MLNLATVTFRKLMNIRGGADGALSNHSDEVGTVEGYATTED
jgi:hypothetical protein